MSETITRYVKERLADERILCYRFHDNARQTIDSWADDLVDELNRWPEDRPWRLILDIRMKGATINTYALRRAGEIARMRPELPGRLAVLIGSKLAADIVSMAIRAANNQYRQRQIFVSEALAIHWLLDEKRKT